MRAFLLLILFLFLLLCIKERKKYTHTLINYNKVFLHSSTKIKEFFSGKTLPYFISLYTYLKQLFPNMK